MDKKTFVFLDTFIRKFHFLYDVLVTVIIISVPIILLAPLAFYSIKTLYILGVISLFFKVIGFVGLLIITYCLVYSLIKALKSQKGEE